MKRFIIIREDSSFMMFPDGGGMSAVDSVDFLGVTTDVNAANDFIRNFKMNDISDVTRDTIRNDTNGTGSLVRDIDTDDGDRTIRIFIKEVNDI